MTLKHHILIIVLLLGMGALQAQTLTLSPYSRYGIGDILNSTTTRNAAMGGIGIATDNYLSINRANPASYADMIFTTFDVAGFFQTSTLRSEAQREEQYTGGFQSIAMGFSANRDFGLVFGFAPYSVVGYEVNGVREGVTIGDTTATEFTSYEGAGGLNQAFIGGAYKFFKRRLSVGVNLSYLFGRTSFESNATLQGIDVINFRPVTLREEYFLNGVGAQLGVIFTDSLGVNSNVFYRVGATVDFQSRLNGDRIQLLDFIIENQFDPNRLLAAVDTLNDQEGRASIPMKYGVGFMLTRPGFWSLGADLTYQDWEDFSLFGREDQQLGDEFRVAVGGEWIPNFQAKSYLGRINYRFGGYFKQSYILFGDEEVNDMGLTIGLGLPASRQSNSRFDRGRANSQINISAAFGKRGNITPTQPVEELYIRIRVGVTLNDTWFIKRVID